MRFCGIEQDYCGEVIKTAINVVLNVWLSGSATISIDFTHNYNLVRQVYNNTNMPNPGFLYILSFLDEAFCEVAHVSTLTTVAILSRTFLDVLAIFQH